MLVAYGFGYYQGSQSCSLKSTSFALAVNEALYDDLQKNRLDLAQSLLKTVISGESRSLKTLKDAPLSYFEYEVTTASAGDIPKQLQKADEITNK